MESEQGEASEFRWWHGVLLAEGTAVAIALATTITPSKTGSKTGIAGHFYPDPTFLQELVVNLVSIHFLLVTLALVVALWVRFRGHTEAE